jgi:glycosyltransferase involved in cell wall biosynthesis
VVDDGVTGYLTPMKDRDAYAERLASLLADPSRARALGAAGRAAAVGRFDRTLIVRRYEDLYRRLLAESSARPALGQA